MTAPAERRGLDDGGRSPVGSAAMSPPRRRPARPLLALLLCLVACCGDSLRGPAAPAAAPTLVPLRGDPPEAPPAGGPSDDGESPEEPCDDGESPEEPLPDGLRPAHPGGYADKWLRRALAYWGGSQGDLAGPLRRMVAARWPRVPPALFLAFAASAGRGDDTAARSTQGLANARFHEVGWFGVEAGPVFLGATAPSCSRWWSRAGRAARAGLPEPECVWGPTPSPDPSLPYSRWAELAADPRVVSLLGRTASVAPGAWVGAIEDQVAVGLVGLGDHGDAVNSRLPQDVRALDRSGPWFWYLAFAGWSAGDNLAGLHVRRYRAEIAGAPESRRVGALVRAAACAAACGAPGPAGSHINPAFSILRTVQKRALAARLAAALGAGFAFFAGDAPGPGALRALVLAAYGRPPGRGSVAACPSACPSSPRSRSRPRSPGGERSPSPG